MLSVGDGGNDSDVAPGSCQDCASSLNHVVVFTAPAAGTYEFSANDGAQVFVFEGNCTTLGTELGCNDDASPLVSLALDAGDVVTVMVSEVCEASSAEGTLSITQVIN